MQHGIIGTEDYQNMGQCNTAPKKYIDQLGTLHYLSVWHYRRIWHKSVGGTIRRCHYATQQYVRTWVNQGTGLLEHGTMRKYRTILVLNKPTALSQHGATREHDTIRGSIYGSTHYVRTSSLQSLPKMSQICVLRHVTNQGSFSLYTSVSVLGVHLEE